MTQEELKRVLDLHALWLSDPAKGKQARFIAADLSGANLSGADLSGADLRSADLSGASLSYADLRSAVLSGANLSGANLSDSNLSGANLLGSDLSGADLSGADLSGISGISGADLEEAKLDNARGLPDIVSPGLAGRVLHQIRQHPETYDQKVWHCETRHCAAGWCIELAGAAAKTAETYLGTRHAALLALGLPLSAEAPFGSDDDPIPWLEDLALAEREAEEARLIDVQVE